MANSPLVEPTLEEIMRLAENWTPAAKERALIAYRERTKVAPRVFYCKFPGRMCDGKPHEGYEYQHARSDQWPPPGPDWFVWALVGGRGSGKTRAGAEYIRKMSEHVQRISLIAPTTADVRDTMIEGESGLQAVFAHVGQEIQWEPSKRKITFPSGAIGSTFSGEEPDRLRGPQHGLVWADEPAHYPDTQAVWDMMLLGLRLGSNPRVAVTTTPLPTKWMTTLLKDPLTRKSQVSTYANLGNLAPTFARNILKKYEGTRLGRQELHGEILADVVGALWNGVPILRDELGMRSLERIVVFIDPAGTNNRKSDETGIVVAGKIGDQYFVLEDLSGKYSPTGWATAAIKAHIKWQADAIGAEKNYGGDMVKTTIESTAKEMRETVRVIIATATRSKQLRAEPIVALYEQENVFHVGDHEQFEDLETEMLTWVPGVGDSPNRIDALVWALTELSGGFSEANVARPRGRIRRDVRSTGRLSPSQLTPGIRRRP